MTRLNILQEDRSYTFRSYFEMNAEPKKILFDLGYALRIANFHIANFLVLGSMGSHSRAGF